MRSAQIRQMLPEIFQASCNGNDPLSALLEAMADQLSPILATLDSIDSYFDPLRCPDDFVPFLATWVDQHVLLEKASFGRTMISNMLPTGQGRMRFLIAHAAELSKWRGTSRGLLQFLSLATGVDTFQITENPDGLLFHIDVKIPPELRGFVILVRSIVELEKPAYVTYRLLLDAPAGTKDLASTV